MAQTYYVRQDKAIEGQIHDEFERERDALEAAFESVFAQSGKMEGPYTADTTVTKESYLILGDASAGAITITLPSAADAGKGKRFLVKKLDTANTLTIATGGGTIDGAATYQILAADGKKAVELISDGSVYHLIGSFAG